MKEKLINICEFCRKEPIAFAILDTYSVPKWYQYIQYVGLNCLRKAIKRKMEDSYYKYAPYWLVLRENEDSRRDK